MNEVNHRVTKDNLKILNAVALEVFEDIIDRWTDDDLSTSIDELKIMATDGVIHIMQLTSIYMVELEHLSNREAKLIIRFVDNILDSNGNYGIHTVETLLKRII